MISTLLITHLLIKQIFCGSFQGNRTNLPNLKIRNGSDTADVEYWNNAKGNLIIPLLQSNLPNEELQNFQDNWFKTQKMSINYNLFEESATESYYNEQLLQACAQGASVDLDLDIIIMDATLVSAYKDCLIDLWAWDFNLGSGIDNIKLSNGVFDDQLVALPYETYNNIIIYNKVYLESHGFDEPPKSLVEMEEMVKFIQISERGAENYKVFGYGSGYADGDDMTGFAAELATSTNSIIISKDSNSSIATGDFRNAISMLLGWMNDQVIDPDDFKLTSSEAFEKFKLRQLIFLRSTPKQLLDMEDVPFDWSVTNLPGFNVTNLNGSYTGNLNGQYIGVYKYSKNPAAAVKAVNYFSSKGYQDVLTANKDFGKTYLTNPYRNSFSDESNCELFNELCPVYDNTITSLRPGHSTGTLYPNVSSIIRDGLMAIFDGTKDLNNGIDQMDDQIRILLKMPFRNSTSSIKPPHKPGKKPLKNLAEQALVLIIFVGVGLVAVMLYRQKLIVEKAKEELERLRVMESARLKKEGKQSADGASNDEKSTLLQ